MPLLTIGTAGAAVAGAFLPWVVYNRGGGNGTVRLSGVHASAIGALVVVAGVVMAVGGLLSVLAPDNQRGGVLALSSAAGFLVCFSALYQHVDLGGVGPVAQAGPGWILATGSFGCTLAAAIAIWLTDVWQRQMEPREPSP